MQTTLAWQNLIHNKTRTLVALAGIAFMITLLFVQLGLRAALLRIAMYVYDRLRYDIVLVSPHYIYIDDAGTFPRSRLYQALAVNGVESAMPFYTHLPVWQNPHTGSRYYVQMLAFHPRDQVFLLPEIAEQLPALRHPDAVLIDRYSRPELGAQDIGVVTELNRHKITIAGQFSLGNGFTAFGTIIVSDQTFSRILHGASLERVNLGLLTIVPGVLSDVVAHRLRHVLPSDVQVLTHSELEVVESRYWMEMTATGIMFNTGVLMAFLVGVVVLYQVLATDVSNRLSEYATLKALGYPNGYMSCVVLQQAFILAVLGFVPALVLTLGIYEVIAKTAHIAIGMTGLRIVIVLNLTVGMCSVSGLIALRKARKADPAELF